MAVTAVDSLAPSARTNYAGSGWVSASLRVEMSPFGELVADILGAVYRGIYHMDGRALRRVDWSANDYIRVAIRRGNLCTFDGGSLTELVILAHDAAVRMEVEPAGPYNIALRFWPRGREGGVWDRHPTIEEAIGRARELAHVEPLGWARCRR